MSSTGSSDHRSALIAATFELRPSNQPGRSVVATIRFGEAIWRLPHRAIHFVIDACYLKFLPHKCLLPSNSWAFDAPLPTSTSVTTTKSTERSHKHSKGSKAGTTVGISQKPSASTTSVSSKSKENQERHAQEAVFPTTWLQ